MTRRATNGAPANRRARPSRDRRRPARSDEAELLSQADASLLELVDHVLNRGVMVTGDLVLGIADVDLVYVRVSAILCAADRVLGPSR
jgi:hypothetical protein